MDSVVSAALEEICARGAAGINVADIWPLLRGALSAAGLPADDDAVHRAVWVRLLVVPGLRFISGRRGAVLESGDPSLQSPASAQAIGARVAADEQLRDSFLGIYDLKVSSSEVSEKQRKVLEIVAAARTKGVTQSELSKEINVDGNKLFYVVKQLEFNKLILRQPTIIKGKEFEAEGEDAPKYLPPVATNLLHLCRYAKNINLNPQQRFEITRPDALEHLDNVDGSYLDGDGGSQNVLRDVLVKNYLPAMKDVCHMLEEAREKVLVVSHIKSTLGYKGTKGHREWRSVLNRLKDSRLVEEIELQLKAKDKVVKGLKLLKKFDLKDFQSIKSMSRHDVIEDGKSMRHAKRGQITDQFVELPLEHRIYDMVDAAGETGITITEIGERIGCTSKKIHNRIGHMRDKIRMPLRAEMPQRTKFYRLWTARNFPHFSNRNFPGNNDALPEERDLLDQSKVLPLSMCSLEKSFPSRDCLEEMDKGQSGLDSSCTDSGSNRDRAIIPGALEPQCSEALIAPHDQKPVCTRLPDSDDGQSERCPAISICSELRSGKRHPCVSAMSATIREQEIKRILKTSLQKEKFILKVELHKHLEALNENKHIKMDKRTLARILNKFQSEGLCKCSSVSIPVVTNYSRSRVTDIVLHPSVDNLQELLEEIYWKQRYFDTCVRREVSSKQKNSQAFSLLSDLRMPSKHLDERIATSKAMRANGYVSAKMVSAKLLHKFLWGYLCSLSKCHDPVDSTCQFFALNEAVKAMPLQLFLQVVGSSKKEVFNMNEHCRLGSRLSEIPSSDYKMLMDIPAQCRLSSIINILIRLKLLQLVGGRADDVKGQLDAVLTYSMELKPYIEEPSSHTISSLNLKDSLSPGRRHEFDLTHQEAVDNYWETLEYCYAAADQVAASRAFPGCHVREVFSARSWSSLQVMTAEQRMELLNLCANVSFDKKIPFQDCVRIARELNLTVEQVLRVSNDGRQSRLCRYSSILKSRVQVNKLNAEHHESSAQKRKRCYLGSGNNLAACENLDAVFRDDSSVTSTVASEKHDKHAEQYSFISRCISQRQKLKHKVARSKRFLWSDKSDSELVMQYARYRVMLGARFFRVDWNRLSDLPADPLACCRRMALLKSNLNVRKAIMRLCNLLSEHYNRDLERTQIIKQNKSLLSASGSISHSNPQQISWYNFEDPEVKAALQEVIRYKALAKLDRQKKLESRQKRELTDIPPTDGTNLNMQDLVVPKGQNGVSLGLGDQYPECTIKSHNVALSGADKLSSYSREKFVKLLNIRHTNIIKRVHESLAVANAVELLKLSFLRTSSAPEVQTSLSATLRLYSEQDVYAAYNYLQDKNFTDNGRGNETFALSSKFYQRLYSSPFPVDSDKRAKDFSGWLSQHENDLIKNGINLGLELQCGELFHLFAVVSLGEVSISPCLPSEGIGEADEFKNSESISPVKFSKFESLHFRKRKCDELNFMCDENPKRHKPEPRFDNDYCSRRAKGFPGIKVILSREKISAADTVHCIVEQETSKGPYSYCMNNRSFPCPNYAINNEPFQESLTDQNCRNMSTIVSEDEVPWESIVSYAESISSAYLGRENSATFSPELFKSVHSSILKSGEQGLDLEQVAKGMDMQGIQWAEIVVNTLETFHLVLKINSFDSVRVVDSSYKSKYFLNMASSHNQDREFLKSHARIDEESYKVSEEERTIMSCSGETTTNFCDGKRLSILDSPSKPAPTDARSDDVGVTDKSLPFGACADQGKEPANNRSSSNVTRSSCPILPWVNVDGTINRIVYKGLTRRLLGTVMQNPGIMEEDIIREMDVLNPQSCRTLLELMIRDLNINMRMLQQTTSSAPPGILQTFFAGKLDKAESAFRKHFFANPMSTNML